MPRPTCTYLDCGTPSCEYVTWQMRLVGRPIGKPVRRPYCGVHGEIVADPQDVLKVEPITDD